MEDKPFEFRDRVALEIINGLLSATSGSERRDIHRALLSHFDYFDRDQSNDSYSTVDSVERVCRYAYSIADIMRKVRLDTFG